MASLAKTAHLSAPVKFTLPEKIKSTLQQERLYKNTWKNKYQQLKELFILRVRALVWNYLMTSRSSFLNLTTLTSTFYEIILAGATKISK